MPADSAATAPRPRLLDIFCGAGVGAVGYHRAGWEVIGVDLTTQPHYPYGFHHAEALETLRHLRGGGHIWAKRGTTGPYGWFDVGSFQAIHASPPCQFATDYRRKGYGVGDGYPNLIPETRMLLEAMGLPYVIENVEKAKPWLRDPTLLCGSMFGLDVQRHRLFETSWRLTSRPCRHDIWTPRFPAATNRAKNSRRTVEVGVWRIPLETQKAAMGVDWEITRPELSQGIPPAYTEFIGRSLIEHVQEEVAA